ncbi:UDP-N-acetylmuramyl-tripeptide synthetase [Acidaminobacter sp. JC074]|uniref:Mur ligase family protein n=1 Tax=Acidaminobacter sp. JC074 TaxID=2530199 RepID=UPI001F0D5748|nr:UDP-N-acetylmuramyl-tripeptide synthetase [Acidaminobacter sp. JC074]MCH4886889.1 UDP-N-acetylmuramyl-tripeptide synthetase [Acidaminobacter sp. JC074]
MNIHTLLQAIDVIDSRNEASIDIKNIQYHSKKVTEGSLFVCVKGYKVDGHDYLKSAKDSGALAAIVEDYMDIDIMQFRVKDSRLALALLADKFYNHPSSEMKLIGITASNGKTSTSFMLNSILEAHQLKTGLIGTVIVKIDDEQIPSVLTTPESLDLHHYFRMMRDKGVSHATMEVSSSALELKRSAGADFDIVTLNNITREHIDNHGSFEAYYNFKAGLIRDAKADAVAILNLDDPMSIQLKDQTQAQVITYGVNDKSGHVWIENLDLSTGRARFTLHNKLGYQPFDIHVSIPGFHCVYNSLVAISAAMILKIPTEDIQKGISSLEGVERRFEYIFEDNFKIIDDHFANAGNIDVTLETLDYMTYKDLHFVYAIRGSRGVTVNKENAEAIVKWSKKLGVNEIIATKSIGHVIWKDEVTDEEEKVFLDVMKEANIKVHLYDKLEDAISKALNEVNDDDLILLAGCQGMDYGCNIALNQIEKMRPDIPRDVLRRPLKHRVAGLLEGEINE